MCFDVPHSARYMQEVVPVTAGVLSYVLCSTECVDMQYMEKIFWYTRYLDDRQQKISFFMKL